MAVDSTFYDRNWTVLEKLSTSNSGAWKINWMLIALLLM